jgi:predicted rRNA methylase YqxC with S4 and FtsJ domains
LKPQFEAEPKDLNRGIVKNEKIRRDIIKNFEQWLKQNDFLILNKRDNSLQGKHGNTERFYLLTLAK